MYFYVKNLQGDIVNIVDSSGNVQVRYDYDVLGKITAIKNGNNQAITDTSSLAYLNPLRYRGYVFDDETGLYYLRSRYYDPVTGRFLNADVYFDTETGSPLSTNMFAYCENNGIFSSDPTGYWESKAHEKLCCDVGFNKTVQGWAVKPDIRYPSDKYYSSPFHSRSKFFDPTSLQIAVYLYNKAISILNEIKNGNTKKIEFQYGNSSGTRYLNPYYLGYIGKVSGHKDAGKKVTHLKRAKNLLTDLNGLHTKKDQSDAFLGLALHVLQDHFAHLTYIYICDSKGHYQSSDYYNTTSFSNNIIKSGGAFEDDTKQIKWRFPNTKMITRSVLSVYKQRKKIKRIVEKSCGSMLTYYYYAKNQKKRYTLKTTEFYLYIYT